MNQTNKSFPTVKVIVTDNDRTRDDVNKLKLIKKELIEHLPSININPNSVNYEMGKEKDRTNDGTDDDKENSLCNKKNQEIIDISRKLYTVKRTSVGNKEEETRIRFNDDDDRTDERLGREIKDKFHIALFRSETEFLKEAKKRRSSMKTVTKWQSVKNESDVGKRRSSYTSLCTRLKVTPTRSVSGQLGGPVVTIENRNFNRRQLKALCGTIQGDRHITTLNLSGNTINDRESMYLTKVLVTTPRLSTLILDNCGIQSFALKNLSNCLVNTSLKRISLSGNEIADKHHSIVTEILKRCPSLKYLNLSHNCLEGEGCRFIAIALEKSSLKKLDLSWNHIRRRGSIALSKCLKKNCCLTDVDFSWNGFAYEGCSALSESLQDNITLTKLNLASNRIHPPAMLELARGLCKNKALRNLNLSYNPITPAFTSILIDAIKRSPEMALNELIMKGIVVDKPFVETLREIQEKQYFEVIYELSLPVYGMSEEKMRREVEAPAVFNVDPLRLLYMLKEKNRAQDFFRKINKDKDESLSPDELRMLFKEAGVPVSALVIEKIVKFMDKDKDGKIDLGEFLEGDKKIRKMSREIARTQSQGTLDDEDYTKYSRSFKKGQIDPQTYRLNISETLNPLSPIQSSEGTPYSTPRKLSMY